ncbi:hypothetical protein Droror1_Dr00007968 [Drosera rotundifolia]
MASSQVEIPSSSSSPFGSVLKDHNRKENKWRDNQNVNANSKTQSRNLKELVRDHLNSCISISPKSTDSIPNENSALVNQGNRFGCWGCNNSPRGNTNVGDGRDHWGAMSPVSKKRSRVLDRWAAHQANETTTTFDHQNQEEEPVAMPEASSSENNHSPAPSDTDLRVSSLVRKWRGYENKNKKPNPDPQNQNNSQIAASRTSSVSAVSTENETTPGDERFESRSCSNNENESTGGWESDETVKSCDQVGEQERMRVVDIIRKWTLSNQRGVMGCENKHDQQSTIVLPQLARLQTEAKKGEDRRGSSAVVCSPRLRGRQAIADLFMRMERERYKEIEGLSACQAVTKFQHRGRIQSMLRLRFLRLGGLVEDHRRRPSRACGSNKSQHKLVIDKLREKLSQASELGNGNMKGPRGAMTSGGNLDTEKRCSSDQPSEESNHTGKSTPEETNHEESSYEQVHRTEEIRLEATNHHEEFNSEERNSTSEEVDRREQILEQHSQSVIVEENTFLDSAQVLQEESIHSFAAVAQDRGSEGCYMESREVGAQEEALYDEFEEDMIYEEEIPVTNLDWINEISRPCSYWEDRRQAWYKEMTDSSSANEEIRKLIKSKSVSAVLTSAFRQRMDNLIMSCVERQMLVLENEEDNDQSWEAIIQRDIRSLPIQEVKQHQLQEELIQEREDQEQERRDELEQEEEMDQEQNENEEDNADVREEEEDEGKELSSSSVSYNESVDDYFDQTPSSSRLPWSHYHEDSDDSEPIGSTPFQQTSITNSYDHDTHEGSSSKNFSTVESGIIYDLRAHMEQLYREMSELRSSIKSCMDMQVMMQNYIREEVKTALRCSGREEKRGGSKKTRKKGNCCICYEKKVDSLLYRCGHMCTCFKCAHELQWNSGKCPICQADVKDVVRAYRDT